MKPEEQHAIAFVEAFRRQWPKLAGNLLHIANEGGNRGQHPGYHAKRARMGVRKGTADYFLAETVWLGVGEDPACHGLWLELKAPSGVLKTEQIAFLTEMTIARYYAATAWGWVAAMRACYAYLAGEMGYGEPWGYPESGGDWPLSDLTLGGKPRGTKKEAR